METAALLRLRELDFIPAIQRFDTRQAVIEMDYIWGRDLRQIISMDAENIDYDDVSRKFDAIMAADDQNEVSMQMSRILGEVVARGVILRDIHAGNFIQGRHSNKLYLVDFNFVHLRSAFKNVS
jgi:tRNA A-37 threonylcarbamoyl transferase component Bud32